LQSLAATNPHWARVVVYSLFSLCVIHKEGLCPSSGDINRLMMTTSMEERSMLLFSSILNTTINNKLYLLTANAFLALYAKVMAELITDRNISMHTL
jgi:hypothetical protein